jgi:hypothetical protein
MSNLLTVNKVSSTEPETRYIVRTAQERLAVWEFLKILTICMFFLVLFLLKSYLDNPTAFAVC